MFRTFMLIALMLFTIQAKAQSSIPLCNRISVTADPSTQAPLLVFSMFAQDLKGSVSCKAPASLLTANSLSAIYLTLYWERSLKQFPLVVRIYNARTGQEVQGQKKQLGLYSTVDVSYENLSLSMDDLIIEVTNKSGKGQYVGMGGNILGSQ